MADKEIIGKILFTQDEIWERAKILGAEISQDYAGEELILIGTLKGAVMWMADMMKNITLGTQIDFVSASSYGAGKTSSGVVNIKHDIELDLNGKHVLIIEDIIDTGNTLKHLKAYISDRGAKSVKICTLLDKPSRRTTDVAAEYIGYEVEDLFIVGYGLDFDQKYRNLPYISYLED
ncbi:hypoxanthine phosphoribosyltransferase [Clostridiales Family XIII bacterium PM5-7]